MPRKERCGKTGVMRGWIKSDSMACVGGVYGVFTRYAIGFDTFVTLTHNVREI